MSMPSPHDQAMFDQANAEFGAVLDRLTRTFRGMTDIGDTRDQAMAAIVATLMDHDVYRDLNRQALAALIAVAVNRLDGVNAAIGR